MLGLIGRDNKRTCPPHKIEIKESDKLNKCINLATEIKMYKMAAMIKQIVVRTYETTPKKRENGNCRPEEEVGLSRQKHL